MGYICDDNGSNASHASKKIKNTGGGGEGLIQLALSLVLTFAQHDSANADMRQECKYSEPTAEAIPSPESAKKWSYCYYSLNKIKEIAGA